MVKKWDAIKGENELHQNKRAVLKELKEWALNPPSPYFKVFPNIDNMFFWKVLCIGPPGTAYNKGVFLLTVKFPADYP